MAMVKAGGNRQVGDDGVVVVVVVVVVSSLLRFLESIQKAFLLLFFYDQLSIAVV